MFFTSYNEEKESDKNDNISNYITDISIIVDCNYRRECSDIRSINCDIGNISCVQFSQKTVLQKEMTK